MTFLYLILSISIITFITIFITEEDLTVIEALKVFAICLIPFFGLMYITYLLCTYLEKNQYLIIKKERFLKLTKSILNHKLKSKYIKLENEKRFYCRDYHKCKLQCSYCEKLVKDTQENTQRLLKKN